MAVIDKLEWHVGSAIERGQPPEHGFTHIGFFLAWLMRHGLTNPGFIDDAQISALRDGRLRPNDLADLIDGKLTSDELDPEGAEFATACYAQYMKDYEG